MTQTFGKVDATLGYENRRAFALGNARSKPDLIHPGQTIDYVAVTTPEEFWPITGLIRLGGLGGSGLRVSGGWWPGWPDEPWWKLSGLFDPTIDQSLQAGVADLEQAMAEHGNDHLVIYGYSQGAVVANVEMQRLAEQFPARTKPPDIDFVLSGDLNVPNGGIHARFPGLYIPILDWSFKKTAPSRIELDAAARRVIGDYMRRGLPLVLYLRKYDGLAREPLRSPDRA